MQAERQETTEEVMMFGILTKVAKVAVKTAVLPVAAVADKATLGRILTGEKRSYTSQVTSSIVDDVVSVASDLGDLL